MDTRPAIERPDPPLGLAESRRDASSPDEAMAPAPVQPPAPALTLARLRIGSAGHIKAIGGDSGFRRRLLELGVMPGVEVRVIRSAPLRDPIEIEVRGYRLSLRKAEADAIAIEAEAADLRADPTTTPGSDRNRATTEPLAVLGSTAIGPLDAAHTAPHYRVAVAGNPNTGKTTLFNALTGANAQVGNYPGITVDRRVGRLTLADDVEVELIDIPGTYSLNARSREEQLALDEMLGRTGLRAPEALLVMLNASALARSLYLLLQVQEFGLPVIGVVNMADEAEAKGLQIDIEGLERRLGIPLVAVSARTKHGVDQLKDKLLGLLQGDLEARLRDHWHWQPGPELAAALDRVTVALDSLRGVSTERRRRAFALWSLMSLREGDDFAGIPNQVRRAAIEERAELKRHGRDIDMEVAQARYRFIDRSMQRFVRQEKPPARDLTGRIDSVLTHPVAGMLIFVVVMALVFTAIFDWAAPLMDSIDAGFNAIAGSITAALPESLLADLLANGLIKGVGSVMVFLPQIVILFFFLTLLEGSGYMSRAAFMMDRVMRKIGLQGKAFVPLMSGYACAIPAVMATRTLENHRDRLLTMMVIPLVSCSARLPVYTLVIGALFPAELKVFGPISLGTLMMLGVYLLSMAVALVAAAVLGRVLLRGKRLPLLIELPPYRMPSARTVGLVLWQKARLFLRTAGTVIVAVSLILWVLLSMPRPEEHAQQRFAPQIAAARARGNLQLEQRLRDAQQAERLRNSYAGRLGQMIEPLIAPLGFDWKIGIGLIGSFAAREVFVATMGLVYGVGEADEDSKSLREAIHNERRPDGSLVYTPLTGLSLLVFFMLAMQCMSTLAVVRQETRSWKWALFMLAYITALAYVGSLLVYQGGRLLGF